jgi:predicted chitinase
MRSDPLVYAPVAVGASALAFAAFSRGAAAHPSIPPTMIVTVTPEALANMGVTGQRPQTYAAAITRWLNFFEINTPNRVAHFFGQILHESGAMQHMRELPSSYVSSRSRWGGRGLTQLTGDVRHNRPGNYAQYNAYLARRDRADRDEVPQVDVVARPNLVETLPYSVHSAMWYWDKEDANQYGDRPVTRENVRTIIARILRPAATAYHLDARFRYAQSAVDQIDLGTITFLPEPAATESTQAAFPTIVKGGRRLVKGGVVGSPAKNLGLFTRGEEINGRGVAVLGIIAGVALMPALRG